VLDSRNSFSFVTQKTISPMTPTIAFQTLSLDLPNPVTTSHTTPLPPYPSSSSTLPSPLISAMFSLSVLPISTIPPFPFSPGVKYPLTPLYPNPKLPAELVPGSSTTSHFCLHCLYNKNRVVRRKIKASEQAMPIPAFAPGVREDLLGVGEVVWLF
jgi:hypothetical protein